MQTVTVVPQQAWPIDLRRNVEAYTDATQTADFEQIAALPSDAAHGFSPLRVDAADPRVGHASCWLRFDVENLTYSHVALRAVLSHPWLKYVDFYVNDDGHWRHSRTGSAVPLAARDPEVRYSRLPALAFDVAPRGRAQVYIRITGAAPVLLVPQLMSQEAYESSETRAIVLVSVLIGKTLLLTWSMLVASLLYRSRTFVALTMVCGMQTLNYLCMYGYARLYLWPGATEWAYRSTTVIAVLYLAVCMFAVEAALRLQESMTLRRRLFTVCIALLLGLAVFAWLNDIRLASQIATAATIAFLVVLTVVVLILYQRAVPTAGLMLCAMLLMTSNFVLQAAQARGFEPAILVRLSLDMTPNPLYDLFGIAANIVVFAAWMRYITRQRAAAVQRLTDWRQEEKHRLRREITIRTLELREALVKVEEKSRQKTEMLAFVGHDLRAPLATIAGYVGQLSRDERAQGARPRDGTRDAAAVHTAHARAASIEAIERSVDYQLSLIDELLEFSRGEMQPLELCPGDVRIGDLLTEIANHAATLSAQRGNRMVFRMEKAIPAVLRADGKRLRQVLLNLLSNAAKFTWRGTITMEVGIRPLGAHADCSFAVVDTGEGIDLQAQQNIFHAFHQLERARGGTGLGLHIAERILREMHSSLRVQSVPGVGSRFTFDVAFPIVDATPHWCPPLTTPGAAVSTERRGARMQIPVPAPARANLLSLAEAGSLSDLEEWLDDAIVRYPASWNFCAVIRDALERLDFERIVDLAKPDADAA
ncbi:MAG: ATP-binding protein [Janthinobacterium lividum]